MASTIELSRYFVASAGSGGVCGESFSAELDSLDELIGAVELYLDRTVKVDDADTFYRLRSIPGVGKILGLVLL